jgi:MEMO1 family protein
MSRHVDEAEYSGEMQLPYIHRLLQKLYPKEPPSNQPTTSYPRLVPIMIGNTSPATEAALGKLLAPYIADESNAFVISSDFCHWGSRFRYTYYLEDAPSPAISALSLPNGVKENSQMQAASTIENVPDLATLSNGIHLDGKFKGLNLNPRIYESIAHADRACMCAIASGKHGAFLKTLEDTGNTVCGRHPIGVFMAAVEEAQKLPTNEKRAADGKFRFVRYERSSDVVSVRDSSVSYVSGFAVL